MTRYLAARQTDGALEPLQQIVSDLNRGKCQLFRIYIAGKKH
jgi:hypothetical protein